jgi:hypothetical protein
MKPSRTRRPAPRKKPIDWNSWAAPFGTLLTIVRVVLEALVKHWQ